MFLSRIACRSFVTYERRTKQPIRINRVMRGADIINDPNLNKGSYNATCRFFPTQHLLF